jgi:hypothetical protein
VLFRPYFGSDDDCCILWTYGSKLNKPGALTETAKRVATWLAIRFAFFVRKLSKRCNSGCYHMSHFLK